MQFRVLGSFEVVDDGRTVELGGYKQRAALVILLLSANRVVPVDRLVDELWGERPPRQATASLQAYISNLRRALQPDRAPREPSRLLRSEGGGYVLAIDLADIDAATFEHRTAEGRTFLRQGRAGAAREALQAALTLWRGPALVEFAAEPFARSEAARLEELRAVADEDRLEADLALGDHATVIAEAQRLVVDEPLRERLWSHLMLALYRSGRQADALAAYRRYRQTLADELGLDPSAALRKLEADVLQQAPSLDRAPDESTPAQERRAADRLARRAMLTFHDAQGRVRTHPLEETADAVTIGRESSADVWLSWDGRVSRRHAELRWRGDQWAVVDEGLSSNGTYVNGERIAGRRALADGDELCFGETVMLFRLPAEVDAVETYLGE